MLNNQNNTTSHSSHTPSWLRYSPLVILVLLACIFSIGKQVITWNFSNLMYNMMGSFFVLLSLLKIMHWKDFVDAYCSYDIIAQKSRAYAYAYPLIELILGIAYLLKKQFIIVNIITLCIMCISMISVARALIRKDQIFCACMGTIFQIPLTYITFVEDFIMALMALVGLLFHMQ